MLGTVTSRSSPTIDTGSDWAFSFWGGDFYLYTANKYDANDPYTTVIVRSRPFGVRRSATRVERRITTDSQGRFSLAAEGASRLLELDVDDASYRAEEAVEAQLMQQRGQQARTAHGALDGLVTEVVGCAVELYRDAATLDPAFDQIAQNFA